MSLFNPFAFFQSDSTRAASGETTRSAPEPGMLARSANERHRQLVEFNESPCSDPGRATLPDLVEAQVSRLSGRLAIRSRETQLTYGEMWARAARVARTLRNAGIGPGAYVGLDLVGSIERAIAVLGVLRVGATCVPLSGPRPVLRTLDGRSLSCILTHPSGGDAGSAGTLDIPTLCMRGGDGAGASGRLIPMDEPSPDDWAWITVGAFRGARRLEGATHRDLVRRVCWHREHTILDESARTLQVAPADSELYLQELMCTWSTGGCLVIDSGATSRSPDTILQVLTSRSVERLVLPASTLRAGAHALGIDADFPGMLRELTVVGSPVHIDPATSALFSPHDDCGLNVQYRLPGGPVVTAHGWRGAVETWDLRPFLGRPLPGVRVYILDRDRQLVSRGNPGELYVGGALRGRVASTLERDRSWVPDPYVDDPDAMIHPTGVRARHRADGVVEFMGWCVPRGDGSGDPVNTHRPPVLRTDQ